MFLRTSSNSPLSNSQLHLLALRSSVMDTERVRHRVVALTALTATERGRGTATGTRVLILIRGGSTADLICQRVMVGMGVEMGTGTGMQTKLAEGIQIAGEGTETGMAHRTLVGIVTGTTGIGREKAARLRKR